MKEIVFVTGNKGKVASAQKYFKNSGVKLITYDFNIEEPYVNNIEYISKYKVVEAYKKVKKPCIALDAGFYIHNYPGNPNFPGAFPKRDLLDKIGIDGLLNNMRDIENRECYFKECLSYYDGYEEKVFYGYSYGKLSKEILGDDNDHKWSDLWYVFIPNNCDKTLSQMSDLERINRNDGHTNSMEEFVKWYVDLKIKS